jgi:hypothetical protein
MFYRNQSINDISKAFTGCFSISLHDYDTDILCVSLLSHHRCEYNNPVHWKHTRACPHQHSRSNASCFFSCGDISKAEFSSPTSCKYNNLKQLSLPLLQVLMRTCSGVVGTNWIMVLILVLQQMTHAQNICNLLM